MAAKWTRLSGWLITIVGSALAVLFLVDAAMSGDPLYMAIESYPTALSLVLVWTGVLLARGRLIADRFLGRLLAWMGIGVVAISILMVYLYFLTIVFLGRELLSTPVGFLTIGTFGALVGLLVGTYDARALERKRDIQRRERALAAHNERLDKFTSVVSHDLRNPLSVILGRVELMQDGGDGEHLDPIERAGHRMEEIITDLLALSRAGKTIDETESVRLADVVGSSWETVATAGNNLDLRVPDTATVHADRDRLMTVFENLFRNAIEHNDSPVTIRVGVIESETGAGADTSLAGFFVEDDGTGIPAEDRETVFEYGFTMNVNGTGFGLSIVQEIVVAHGWSITVTEGAHGGARFEISTAGPSELA